MGVDVQCSGSVGDSSGGGKHGVSHGEVRETTRTTMRAKAAAVLMCVTVTPCVGVLCEERSVTVTRCVVEGFEEDCAALV